LARLEPYRRRFPRAGETLILDAITAATKSPERAGEVFWEAFLNAPDDTWRPLKGRLILLEVLEALLERTRDPRYRELIVEYARRQTRYQEFSAYAYAFEARYAASTEQQVPALAYALFLDRHSRHISQMDDELKREAHAWWQQHRVFGSLR
jgi:hypothetical protein